MIRVCGFDDTISWRRAFVPQRMKRKRRGTRCTTCRRVSVLCTRQATESVRIRPSTVTQASRQRNSFRVSRIRSVSRRSRTTVSRTGVRRSTLVAVTVLATASSLRSLMPRRRMVSVSYTHLTLPTNREADGVGIPGAEAFEFGAAQTQCLHRGCLLSQPGAVVFDARGQGILVLCEAAGFVAVTGIAVCQQRRYEDGVKEKVFFHGFRVLRRR